MKPQKKSYFDVIVSVFAFFFFLFAGLQAGNALNEIDVLDTLDAYSFFINRWSELMEAPYFEFEWSFLMFEAVGWSLFIWFVLVASWFTSKRKYIAGKEYGTAEWASPKDLEPIHAENLMKEEIKQAKRVRKRLGRWFEKRKAYKKARKICEDRKSVELDALEEWKSKNIPDGESLPPEEKKRKKENLREYKRRKQEIEGSTKKYREEALREVWKPEKLKWQYGKEIEDIAYQYRQGLKGLSLEQKKAKEQIAKENYEKELRAFYRNKNKIEAIREKYKDADALYTKTERVSIYNYVLNNNTLIIGGSGSGKTRGFVMPNILQAHSSFVITDPKGEILEKAGYFLEEIKGYKIHVLNLDDMKKSDGYNPFVYIHPGRPGYEERVMSLIETIIVNTDGGQKQNSSDPFWPKAERLFLQSVFFFTCDGFPPEEQNMNTVNELIKMLEIGEEEDNKDSDLDYFVKRFKDIHGEHHMGVQQFEEFRSKASGKTAKSIVVSAVARLAPFKTAEVRRIFSYDTMALDRLGEEKTAVFVVVPPTNDTFNFIAGMLFTQMFQELQYCATQVHKHDGQRLPVPVRFILDEFKNTCKIPNFVKILAYARSFGIGIVPILQSLEQIKEMYEKEWGVIVDNCSTLLYLGGIKHPETLEYMSKLLGKGTFDKRTTGRTTGRSGSASKNYDVIGRELMDGAEIQKMPKQDCLLIVSGKNPFYSQKYDYPSHPNYKYTSDANRANTYEYTPPPPPETKRQKEEELAHHEEEKQRLIAARTKTIVERVNRSVDEIQIVLNPQVLLNRMGQAFEHLAPISDSVLCVDDGSTADTDALLDALNFKEEDEAVNNIMLSVRDKVAQAVEQKVAEAVERTEQAVAASGGEVITEPVELVKKVVSIGPENLGPIANDVLRVDDGSPQEELDLDGYELDDEDHEVSEHVSDDFGDLSGLLAEISGASAEEQDADAASA